MTTTIHHDQALNWFVRLSDADAPEAAWLDFQAWLEADPDHSKAYDLIEQVWVALDDDAPANVVAPIAANDAGPAPRGQWINRAWLAPMMATAAAAVMVVGLWPEISGEGRFTTYSTDDAPREIVLSDGSRLSINRHSDLRVRIGARDREVTMAGGEVAFDVTHDASRPFVVKADDHEVRVLGTAFNLLDHGDRFSVGVTRGLVAVSGRAMPQTVRLSVGDQIVHDGAAAPVVSHVDPEQASAWRDGVLVYRDTDIGTIADDLSRYLNKPVSVSESARALRFTGALRIGDEATMLRQLQDFVPIRATRENDGIRLTARGAG
ncbi:FecR domain-containing protein [Brevundimonas sp. NIBR11]|uniref:FecR family protein n=1 Tax=Brevundimonas sp. NIBR11 TaxID=3015999 RepID=UPI0022F0AAB4|nr:FecR domain-containing protein [Brevundimonas sp. NIBR11]WGM31843.1 Protein FecR [Brevundimonas sp. NIBR11]